MKKSLMGALAATSAAVVFATLTGCASQGAATAAPAPAAVDGCSGAVNKCKNAIGGCKSAHRHHHNPPKVTDPVEEN